MKLPFLARCAFFALAALLGCSGTENKPQTDVAAGAGGEGGTAPAEAGAGGQGEGAGHAAGAAGETELDAPAEEAALLQFLEEKAYAGWPQEAAFHASAGPHGKDVRVYYSPKAAAALNSGAETLPAGAASVKELSSGGDVYGYAVWVKVQSETDAGNGFYWYEVTDRRGTRTVYANSLGSPVCVDCHSTGRDYSLSTLPFE